MTSRLHVYSLKRTVRIAAAVIVVLLIALGVSYGIVHFFTIREILVDAPGMTVSLDHARFGTNLLFLPADALKKDLLSQYPQLSGVEFEKKIPGTLIVRLKKRTVVSALQSSGNFYALDDRGVVVDILTSFGDYPRLQFEVGMLVPGDFVRDEAVITSITALTLLSKTYPIDNFTSPDSRTVQAILGNTRILFPHSGDIRAKAATLQIIIEGVRIKGTLPAVIDLRYQKPIITN